MPTQTENSNSQLLEIARRIREMRWITGHTPEEMAVLTEVTPEEYADYENGRADLPFTFLHKCAMAFGVDVTQLVEGHSAKLKSYNLTRRGTGSLTASEDGITIQNMASMFKGKLATPYWVTYAFEQDQLEKPIHTTTHAGQEFDLVLKGSLKVKIGDHEEILHEGDSIYYNSSTPHGMIAVDGADCTFLAMIMATSEASARPGVTERKAPKQEESEVQEF